MLITFSGLDGSGKSTLIESLKESLEKRQDKRVSVSHMYYDLSLYSFVRSLLSKALGRTSKGDSSAKAGVTHAPREFSRASRLRALVSRLRYRIVWNKSLRFCLYPMDVLIFLLYRVYIEKFKKQILITDRYFYDTLVDVSEGRNNGYSMRLLSLLTPTPNVPVYLDISAEEAHARKNEYSVARLSRRRLSYQQLVPRVPSFVVLSTNGDLEITRHALEKVVLERMSSQ